MANLGQFLGGSVIKSIQRGTINQLISAGNYADITISAVDVNKSRPRILSVLAFDGELVYGPTLVSSTTLRIHNRTSLSRQHALDWEVVEYV